MKKSFLWLLAVIITLAVAIYQRVTGPTYPYRGKATIEDKLIKFKLPRSSENTKDCEVSVKVLGADIGGYLEYKRYKTDDPWTKVLMERKDDTLTAFLPKQPMAGKLEYKTVLVKGEQEVPLSGDKSVIVRFKSHVPTGILIPHVLVMFLAMLFSTRAGFAALDKKSDPRRLAMWATALLFIGGFILGPLVQHFGFGPYWTGIPVGFDLTDNKILVAMIGWLVALIMMRQGKPARGWVVAATILLLVVYSIPHSLLGSELDYLKLNPPTKINLP
jgi:hypothetical protein